ncbi:MAG: hypothetical protein DHS20C19_24040 [Acidimicrobiales bacterium]|nr:MAG: hypothetical protein DHS20C19_24040 [Acidimicrobiales bacterium]
MFDDLIAELALIRRHGITQLRTLDLPALQQAALAAGHNPTNGRIEAPQLETLIRDGIAELGGGTIADTLEILLGLEPGTRGNPPPQLRADAAERWGISLSRFRHRWEPHILSQLADAILTRCHHHAMRLAHLALERRTPTTSRLAIAWVERFEAMYRLWTPIYALAADLTAQRSTQFHPPRRDGSDAGGYVTFALSHYTDLLIETRRYQHRYGGLWLLSDHQAEQDLADALYRITWHTPNNERDDSYLRTLTDTHPEQHQLLEAIANDPIGADIHHEWQDWARRCHCTWDAKTTPGELFATSRHHPDIDPTCQPHQVIQAAVDYCTILDDDWNRIADWYRLPTNRPTTISGETLTNQHSSNDRS